MILLALKGIDNGISLEYHCLKLIFTLQIFMVVWCYLAAVFRDPGGVPVGWTPFTDSEVMPVIASIQAIWLTPAHSPRYSKLLAWYCDRVSS